MLCMTYYSPEHDIRQVIQQLGQFEVSLRQSQGFRLDKKWQWERQNDAGEFCFQVISALREADNFDDEKPVVAELDSSYVKILV